MDKIKDIFLLNNIPMVAVEGNRIILSNASADELFARRLEGRDAEVLIPEHILSYEGGSFVGTAAINNINCTVSARRSGEILYASFSPGDDSPRGDELVSDYLISGMMSAMFSLGLAIDRIRMEAVQDEKALMHRATMSHSYYSLKRSLNNLRTALSLRENNVRLHPSKLDLRRLCGDLCDDIAGLSEDFSAKLEFTGYGSILRCTLDRDLTEQIIMNVISNSLANTEPGDKITVGLHCTGANAIISVDDTGRGIPAARLQNIFTRYREPMCLDSLSNPCTGGLGLSIAKGLSELQGGAMIIESREGEGTRVRIMLPLERYPDGILESPNLLDDCARISRITTEFSNMLPRDSFQGDFLRR